MLEWEEIQFSYTKDVKQGLMKLKEYEDIFKIRFEEIQKKFLEIIEKPDDKMVN